MTLLAMEKTNIEFETDDTGILHLGESNQLSGSNENESLQGEPKLPGIEHIDENLVQALEKAVDLKGIDYRPRTRHLHPNGKAIYTNRLILENSPYLLQHAHNPVNFYPWGNEAFRKARKENKPVMLSVGYTTCHWCHVMERESFEDLDIAHFLNQHYISIKVDREERPDIDDIYMKATMLMTGHGGWPMTVMLTPEGEPFFAGTYFPPYDVPGHAGFVSIIKHLNNLYRLQPDRVAHNATNITEAVRQMSQPRNPGPLPSEEIIDKQYRFLCDQFDHSLGGFGQAPKFPQPDIIHFLFRYYHRSGETQARQMACTTLDKMARGGIYDQIGGGFHRYSTDRQWLIPHFEKMLYDNAQLVTAYLEAYQITGEETHARIARQTLDYLIREMRSDEGVFYTATDADSPTENGDSLEGYYFTWTLDEIESALDTQGKKLVASTFGMSDTGNFEGRNILHLPREEDTIAAELGLDIHVYRQELQKARKILYDVRQKRKPPIRDEKILTAWNALAISAFAKASLILSEKKYQDVATKAMQHILHHHIDSQGHLLRSASARQKGQHGFLEDYALIIASLIDLYEATGKLEWIKKAIDLQQRQNELFADDGAGGYFTISQVHEKLISRDKAAYDNAIPSGNSVSLLNLLRLANYTDDPSYRNRAGLGLKAFAHEMTHGQATFMLSALDNFYRGPLEIVIVKPDSNESELPFLEKISKCYIPNRVLSVVGNREMARAKNHIPMLEGKTTLHDRVTAYVCSYGNCGLPTSDPEEFERLLCKTKR